MIPFQSMDGPIETLIVVFLCLVVANAILAGVIFYIFVILELVDSLKYNRRIGRVVHQHSATHASHELGAVGLVGDVVAHAAHAIALGLFTR